MRFLHFCSVMGSWHDMHKMKTSSETRVYTSPYIVSNLMKGFRLNFVSVLQEAVMEEK
jgi:hypothetical protein